MEPEFKPRAERIPCPFRELSLEGSGAGPAQSSPPKQRALTEAMARERTAWDSPAIPGSLTQSIGPTSSSRAATGRPRERTGPPGSDSASMAWPDVLPVSLPFVLALDQLLDTPQ